MLYIDIFFFMNFVFDFALLLTLALLKREPFLWKQSVIASFVGGIWACFVVFVPTIVKWITMYPVAYIMIRIAFPRKRKQSFIFHFFLIAWTGGGILNFLYNDIQQQFAKIVIAIVVWLVALIGIKKYKRRETSHIYTIELKMNGKKEKMKALWDSGNCLKSPLGEAVCIIEQKTIKRFFEEEGNVLCNWTTADSTFLCKNGFQLIPYHSIGTKEGILPAIRGEELIIQVETKEIVIQNPIIGFCDMTLSTEYTYEMILPSVYNINYL